MIENPFFAGDASHAFRHANAEIDDAISGQFEHRAARDDLAGIERHRVDVTEVDADLTGEVGTVCRRPGLLMIFCIRNDEDIKSRLKKDVKNASSLISYKIARIG